MSQYKYSDIFLEAIFGSGFKSDWLEEMSDAIEKKGQNIADIEDLLLEKEEENVSK